jgi:hypothetical protein
VEARALAMTSARPILLAPSVIHILLGGSGRMDATGPKSRRLRILGIVRADIHRRCPGDQHPRQANPQGGDRKILRTEGRIDRPTQVVIGRLHARG